MRKEIEKYLTNYIKAKGGIVSTTDVQWATKAIMLIVKKALQDHIKRSMS